MYQLFSKAFAWLLGIALCVAGLGWFLLNFLFGLAMMKAMLLGFISLLA